MDELYIDRMSGKDANRSEQNRMMEYVRRGDAVIVESISRCTRNTRDLLDLVERLAEKGIEFVKKNEAIDTTTPTGKIMLTIFGVAAELEREYTLQRQWEGIAIAKEQDKYTERKAKLPLDFERVVDQWHRGKITAVEAMRILHMSKTAFYRKVKQNVIIVLSNHSPDVGSSHGANKAGEKLLGPEATVETEGKFIEIALQMLFAQAMVSSQKKGLYIGDQGVYPAQSAAAFIKDLIAMDAGPLECSAKRPEGVAADLASGTNDLLGDGTH